MLAGPSIEKFEHLPRFAAFIRERHVDEFLKVSYELLRRLDVPLMRPLSEEEGRALADKSNLELLSSLVDNNPATHIQLAIERWRDNQFPKVQRNQMVVEDVTRIAHARKLSFLDFLPRYTKESQTIVALVAEIDAYILQYTTSTLLNFVDIMDERLGRHLAKLETTEAMYKQAEAIAHIGHWNWDCTSNKVTWTDEMYRIFGMEPLENGITFDESMSFVHPDDTGSMSSTLQRSLSTGLPFEYFHRIITRQARTKFLHERGEVLTDKHGKVTGMIGTTQDVTALKEAEMNLMKNQQELLHRTQALQASNESLEEFAFVASHDLKEPLRKISTFLSMLIPFSERGTVDEQFYFSRILSSTKRMTQMIDDLLTLALVHSEKQSAVCNLEEIVRDIKQVFEDRIRKAGASIETDGLPEINGTTSQINLLFQNLVGNAIKFRKKDVPLQVRITHNYRSPNELDTSALEPAQRYLELVFSDNGIGFTNNHGEKIFALFQRLHTKEEYEGTGIGLAICRKIVRNHGGTITAKGLPGEGAQFIVLLPA
jgi:PAS domain S-box-containing protein